jgi:pilus assembly protein Flp/PilA
MTEMILALVNYFKLPVMDEKGQGMVEYALIIVLVAIAVIGTLTILGTTISGVFTTITGSL